MSNAKNLRAAIGAGHTLTEGQQSAVLSFVGYRCSARTKARLARRLSLPLALWDSYGIYERVFLTPDGAEYCCGQSWTDEMRTLRECML